MVSLINIFYISEVFISAIKNQAIQSQNEIYGWLIGYQKDNIPNVLAIIECKRFEQQTVISAIPNVQEFQEISSILPQGIGPIGIYHSHPFSSEIFHSHIDDATLISLSNQFPNSVSIVTNGSDVNYYQMGEKSKTKIIEVKYIEPEIPKFLLFSLNEALSIYISKDIFKNLKNANSLKIRIFNEVSNFLENIWSEIELLIKMSKISKTSIIKKYLVNDLKANSIQLRISTTKKKNNIIQLFIKNNNNVNSKDKFSDKEYESLRLDLNVKVPVYVGTENKTFIDLNQIIKTEIISNNLLLKIFNCVMDFDNQKILTPDDYYLCFFGFFIKVLCFNEKKLNETAFSQKNFEYMSKFLSFFKSFTKIELSNQFKIQIHEFFEDVITFSKKFNWYPKIKKTIKLLKKDLNINKK